MEKKILVLEDSSTCQIIARESLKIIGAVYVAENCHQARQLLQQHKFDLILIDMNLPDGNGFEFYGEISTSNEIHKIPTIFITSEIEISKKVAAFSLGAWDYIVKPYSPLELRARVERIFNMKKDDDTVCDQLSGLKLDIASYKAYVDGKDQINYFGLTPNEFKILLLFVKHPDRIYTRNQIIDLIWGTQVFITERTVDTHVSSLRKKLKDYAKFLISVRGEGYKWQNCA